MEAQFKLQTCKQKNRCFQEYYAEFLGIATKHNNFDNETLNCLARARFFTKLDIISAFHKLCNKEGDEWKAAFHTWYGLFKPLVIFFELCNSPSSFQSFINKVFHDFLNMFCTVYLDDILIYSDNEKKHDEYVHLILAHLQEFKLYIDIEKCVFKTQKVLYLGLLIGVDGICIDPQKITTITDWPTFIKLKQIQSFLGFANFYCCFIVNFFKITKSLTCLI